MYRSTQKFRLHPMKTGIRREKDGNEGLMYARGSGDPASVDLMPCNSIDANSLPPHKTRQGRHRVVSKRIVPSIARTPLGQSGRDTRRIIGERGIKIRSRSAVIS